MKKIAGIMILVLLTACSTPEQKENWKKAAAVAAIGLVVLAAASGGGVGGGYKPAAVDYDWDWDMFINNGRYQWACRGLQTGQFAEQSRCAYKIQVDRWPNN